MTIKDPFVTTTVKEVKDVFLIIQNEIAKEKVDRSFTVTDFFVLKILGNLHK